MSQEQVRNIDSLVQAPRVFKPLYQPCRYKVYYGGRGGGKSWAFADALLTLSLTRRIDVLCARELQVSIRDSVHKLLRRRIEDRGLEKFFTVTESNITGYNGSLFSFRGLRHNAAEIKSFEGVDVCWVEEGQKVSQESWDVLRPTIRKEGSEIWVSFNPGTPHDPTYKMFVQEPPAGAVVVKVTWRDNPWFSSALEEERLECLTRDADKYAWIWEGEPRVITEAQVFGGRWKMEEFAIPSSARFYLGADWGFGSDPSVLVRAFLRRAPDGLREICVCNEAVGYGLEISQLPALFERVPFARRALIRADSSRPELIKHMRRNNFIIKGAKKWPGSVEAGISTLRSYGLVIHPSCPETLREMRLYSHKVDPLTEEVLPEVLDKHNHCCDSLRYAFDYVIRSQSEKAA